MSDLDCVVESSRTIELGVVVPGLLAESFFDHSEAVEKGALMARLESDVERVAVAIAEESATNLTGVELRKLTTEFGHRIRLRNSKLRKSNGVSEQVMDQVSIEPQIVKLQVAQELELSRLATFELDAKGYTGRCKVPGKFCGILTWAINV